MNAPFSRRVFLKQSAATTAILGFPFLSVADDAAARKPDPPPTPADLLALARERMKQEIKPGVILVIPSDKAAADQLAKDLADLLGISGVSCLLEPPVKGKVHVPPIGTSDPAARVHFCYAVFVCLPFEHVRQFVPDLKPGTAVVLLDLAGKPVDTLAAAPNLFGKDFTAKMSQFLRGPKGAHLAAVVKAQRDALGPTRCRQLDDAVRDLDANDFTTRQAASRKLAELASRSTALLTAALHDNPTLETRRRLEAVFDDLYAAGPDDRPGPRLPYGIVWEARAVDPCPFCGLSSVPTQARLFLRFATEKKNP